MLCCVHVLGVPDDGVGVALADLRIERRQYPLLQGFRSASADDLKAMLHEGEVHLVGVGGLDCLA